MEKFVADQKQLLSLERDAELEESRLLKANVSLRDLCQKGVAIQRLVVGGQATGLYGRLVLTLVNRVNNQDLAAHTITSGDIVELRPGSSQGQESPENWSGVVTQVTSVSVSVAFSETIEQISLDTGLMYSLVKLANDITHKRLTKALDILAGNPSSAVINVLFDVSSPGVPHQSCHPKLLDADDNLTFFNGKLDTSQKEAVEFCLKQKEVGIVHGPPGTGKTTTVVEIIRQAVRSGDKVLVCAPSNVAVDNLVERLARAKVKVVRLGHPARVNQGLVQHSLDAIISNSDEGALVRDIYRELDKVMAGNRGSNRMKVRAEVKELRKEIRQREKKALKEILSRAEVVLGTLTSSGPDSPLKHLPDKHFDLTVIDECSQALETACWIVTCSASKLLLAGDHLQLPPTILSTAASKGLGLTLMERLVKLYGTQVTRMLSTQYRMNARIMQWASEAMYEGQLRAGDSVRDHTLSQLPGVQHSPITNTVLLMVDTAGCDMGELTTSDNISKANEGEAAIVLYHVKELVEVGVKPEDIAVVTPYNLQVEMLRHNMRSIFPELEIKSVDGFQGREKEVVILSLVRSNTRREVGFLGESRRLNVAVTRARRQLIVVCDTETVKGDKFLGEFVEYLEAEGELRTPDMYPELPDINRPEGVVVALNVKKSSAFKTDSTHLKCKNNEKLKTVTKEISKVDSCSKKSIKPTDNKTVTQSRNDNDVSQTNTIDLSEEEGESSDQRRKEFVQRLNNFLESTECSMTFSSDLNSFERRLVHEISEELNLEHESIGEGKSRYISISKRIPDGGKMENVSFDSSIAQKDINSRDDDSKTKSQNNSVIVTREIECLNCKRMVPKANIDLHKLRCKIQPVQLKAKIDAPKSKEGKGSKNKKKEAKVKVDKDGQEIDDFDSLCDQFQKLDKVCNYPKCKVLVATIGVNCKFCGLRFCLKHSMAEIHGCGEEARKAARQQISREGRLVPGSGAVQHKPDREKRVQLEKRLDKKLLEKNEQRKTKAKTK